MTTDLTRCEPSASQLVEAEVWWRAYVADDLKVGWRGRAALLAEYDRRGAIEQRARKVRDGVVSNGAPWQQNAEIAHYILGEDALAPTGGQS